MEKICFYKDKSAQIWVETVLYTMIAFAIIGLILTYVKPEMEKFQDKSTIKQSINMMSDINSKISEVSKNGEGNKRILELSLKKGYLKIDGEGDNITLEMDSSYAYTEPREEYSEQGVEINTIETSGKNRITLLNNYSSILNITYQEEDKLKTFSPSSTFYRVYIENKGKDGSDNTIVDLGVI